MGRIKTMSKYLSAVFAMALIFSMNVATVLADTNDAVADIMNHDRFNGAISSISWLTGRIDFWFTTIITVTAFFIISTSLLKNACAGAYVANHKFWDKVAEAHEKKDAMNLANMFSAIKQRQFGSLFQGGGIKDFFLGIVPNIKALTDFDGVEIEPKVYFMRAIPQMLACIIIGVFIYNGYYRDTASAVGSFGAEICNRVFSSVDPATALDKLSQTTKTPDNIYATDQTLQGKAIYKLSMEIYRSYLSVAKEFTESDAKASLMRDSENIAYKILNTEKMREFFNDGRAYDYSIASIKVIPSSSASLKAIGQTTTDSVDEKVSDGKLKTEYIDKSAHSRVACSYTGNAPASVEGYINKSEYGKLNINFALNGSQRNAGNDGMTSVKAAAGSWNNLAGNIVTVTAPLPENGKGGKGDGTDTLYNVDYKLKNAEKQATKEAGRAVAANFPGSTIQGYEAVSWSNYQAGTAQNPIVRFRNASYGSTITVQARVTVTYQMDGSVGRTTIVVPVQVVLGK